MDDTLPQIDEAVFGVESIGRRPAPGPDSALIDAFDRHQGELNGFAIQLTRDADVAADLVQEAFLRLVRETKAGRPPKSVRPWLYRVVTNLATSRGRRESVSARWQARLVQHDAADAPEIGFLEREASGEILALLAGVSRDERIALLLSAHGFAGSEIAEVLGRSHLATRSLLCRARARLRDKALELEGPR